MKFPKQQKIRSKKLTQAAKGKSCTLRLTGICNHNNETVVACHLSGNKGTATKNHDIFTVDACSLCHANLDKGLVSAEDQMRALQETIIRRVNEGLIKVL